ncbi:hypothetical protein [Pseudomonas sp. B14(2017)]|uniref:hypothetical protein n=1 Tax=Pseudomonas sp. B14(2017) TaxID=1981745 RepID=UPI000A1E4895|nr:hypothetical protein [Pseudomonas sp. B14(2017)]
MPTQHQIKSIKFYARIPQQDGTFEVKPMFFSVPAWTGGTAPELYVTWYEQFFVIRQGSAAGEFKQYLYKLEDINGRIEVAE